MTVHVKLAKASGEKADVYLREGQLVHATCGESTGAEAVHHVIAWADDGFFSVEPAEEFPPDNISQTNQSLLMEGCRLFDESRRQTTS